MPKIYRIQDKDGRGPWKPGFSHKWVVDRQDHYNLPPWPVEFGFGILEERLPEESLGCGCRTLRQLRRWITRNEYKKLRKFGYKCVALKVDRIIAESDIQCVFAKKGKLSGKTKKIRLYWDF